MIILFTGVSGFIVVFTLRLTGIEWRNLHYKIPEASGYCTGVDATAFDFLSDIIDVPSHDRSLSPSRVFLSVLQRDLSRAAA